MAPNSEGTVIPPSNLLPTSAPPDRKLPQHGVRGVYYGGEWLDIEDCASKFNADDKSASHNNKERCSNCPRKLACRSKSSNDASKNKDGTEYDVVIVGAGCIGSAIARELSKYDLSVLLVEAADDVSQGATKGNSGIVHAGYDDKPGTNRAKFCWKGNQMFAQLDKELRFGYQKNGSLVLAFDERQKDILKDLMKRGETNGVQNLQIIDQQKLRELEPAVHPGAIAALLSPDAGNVIPYEYAIALAENAVDNGVELRVRRELTNIETLKNEEKQNNFELSLRHWEPQHYIDSQKNHTVKPMSLPTLAAIATVGLASIIAFELKLFNIVQPDKDVYEATTLAQITSSATVLLGVALYNYQKFNPFRKSSSKNKSIIQLIEEASKPEGSGGDKVSVSDMTTGGSGSWNATKGQTVAEEKVKAKYVVNCAGGASDKVANMIGDDSFVIKPRLGDYILLNRNQGHLTKHTLFPCPDPVLGKGVLVQTTLWGNLILGPTARDTYKPEMSNMSAAAIQHYILSKCRQLVPYFDPKETIHGFCGSRSKSSRGDWIIEPSSKNEKFIHVAGIDSPGLAGSPAIAQEVVKLLQNAGLETPANQEFNPNRAPIITPKKGLRGLKMGSADKNDSLGKDEAAMASNVVCKCEKVTELEIVRAVRRSLPIDSSQAIRKRTRAGMGHCQGDPENYDCEGRVRAIVARELDVPVEEIGGRPWPATTTLSERWIGDEEKEDLNKRMMEED